MDASDGVQYCGVNLSVNRLRKRAVRREILVGFSASEFLQINQTHD